MSGRYKPEWKERIKAARQARAERYGFRSYGQYRGASESIRKELTDLKLQDVWTHKKDDLLRAKAIIGGFSRQQVKQAAKDRIGLLNLTPEGRAVLARLREVYGFKRGLGWQAVYFPAMRALY